MSKITNGPVWHRMLYSCTHLPMVGVKGLLKNCLSLTVYTLANNQHNALPTIIIYPFIVEDIDFSYVAVQSVWATDMLA